MSTPVNSTNTASAAKQQQVLMANQQKVAAISLKANGKAEAKAEAKRAEALITEQALATEQVSLERQDAAIKAQGNASKAEAEATQITKPDTESKNGKTPELLDGDKPVEPKDGETPELLDGDQEITSEPLTKKEIKALKAGLTDDQKEEINQIVKEGQGAALKEINDAFPPPPPPPTDKKGNPVPTKTDSSQTRTATTSNTKQMMKTSTKVHSASSSNTQSTGNNSAYRKNQQQTFTAKIDFSNSNVASESDITRISGQTNQGSSREAVLSEVNNVLTGVTSSTNINVLAAKTSIQSSINMAAEQVDSAIQSALAGSQSNVTSAQDQVTSALNVAATARAYQDPATMANALFDAEQASDAVIMAAGSAQASAELAATSAQNLIMGLAMDGANTILTVETESRSLEKNQQKEAESKADSPQNDGLGKGINRLVNGMFNLIASGLVGKGRSPAELGQLGINNQLNSSIFNSGTSPSITPTASLSGLSGGFGIASPSAGGSPTGISNPSRRSLLA